jgi:3-methylcrotonyl-CoA carboxylase beta subunit
VRSDRDPAQIAALREQIRERYERQGSPYYATARLWDDGIIDPLATRDTVGLALSVCANAPLAEPRRPVVRM